VFGPDNFDVPCKFQQLGCGWHVQTPEYYREVAAKARLWTLHERNAKFLIRDRPSPISEPNQQIKTYMD